MAAPTYLVKDRTGAFFFRRKIPLQLKECFQQKAVIYKPLNTHHRPTALKLARACAVRSDYLFRKLEMKKSPSTALMIAKGRLALVESEMRALYAQLAPRALEFALGDEIEAIKTQSPEDYFKSLDGLCKELNTDDLRAFISMGVEQEPDTALTNSLEDYSRLERNKADLLKKLNDLTKIYRDSLEHEEKRRLNNILDNELESEFRYGPGAGDPVVQTDIDNSPLLADAMTEYARFNADHNGHGKARERASILAGGARDSWGAYSPKFRLFLALSGNIKTSKITKAMLDEYSLILPKMPDSTRKVGRELLAYDSEQLRFKKPLSEIIDETASILSSNRKDLAVISDITIQGYFKTLKAFAHWMNMKGYLAAGVYESAKDFLSTNRIPKRARVGTNANKATKPLSDEQLNAIFQSPYYDHRKKLARHGNAKELQPAVFWIPIIAMFTGARGNEIAQLGTKDVKQIKNVWCVSLNRDSDGEFPEKDIKNSSSVRNVPLHKDLVRIGFLDFHRELLAAGETKLFPSLYATEAQARRPYEQLGAWFIRNLFRKVLGIEAGNGEVFHSLRHGFISELDNNDVVSENRKPLVGHSHGADSVHQGYTHKSIERMKADVDKAMFQGVDISHLNWAEWKKACL